MRNKVESIVTEAIAAAVEAGELPLEAIPDPSVERPRDKGHGDWATSVAMKLAKQARMNDSCSGPIIFKARPAAKPSSTSFDLASLRRCRTTRATVP